MVTVMPLSRPVLCFSFAFDTLLDGFQAWWYEATWERSTSTLEELESNSLSCGNACNKQGEQVWSLWDKDKREVHFGKGKPLKIYEAFRVLQTHQERHSSNWQLVGLPLQVHKQFCMVIHGISLLISTAATVTLLPPSTTSAASQRASQPASECFTLQLESAVARLSADWEKREQSVSEE